MQHSIEAGFLRITVVTYHEVASAHPNLTKFTGSTQAALGQCPLLCVWLVATVICVALGHSSLVRRGATVICVTLGHGYMRLGPRSYA